MKDFILNPVVRRLVDHPLENRFTHAQFLQGLADVGFHVVGERKVGRLMGWYVADKTETRTVSR